MNLQDDSQFLKIIVERLKIVSGYHTIAQRLNQINGFLEPTEGYALHLLAALGPGDGVIVEIGSFMGLSTAWMGIGAKQTNRGPVIAIDHFRGSPEHKTLFEEELKTDSMLPYFEKNIKALGLEEIVHPLVGSSRDAAQTWTQPIRLLFLDGEHSYTGVSQDFALFSEHVVKEGIICFHDVNQDTWPDVTEFYESLLKEENTPWIELFRIGSLGTIGRKEFYPQKMQSAKYSATQQIQNSLHYQQH